jgi:hypothetical protein
MKTPFLVGDDLSYFFWCQSNVLCFDKEALKLLFLYTRNNCVQQLHNHNPFFALTQPFYWLGHAHRDLNLGHHGGKCPMLAIRPQPYIPLVIPQFRDN